MNINKLLTLGVFTLLGMETAFAASPQNDQVLMTISQSDLDNSIKRGCNTPDEVMVDQLLQKQNNTRNEEKQIPEHLKTITKPFENNDMSKTHVFDLSKIANKAEFYEVTARLGNIEESAQHGNFELAVNSASKLLNDLNNLIEKMPQEQKTEREEWLSQNVDKPSIIDFVANIKENIEPLLSISNRGVASLLQEKLCSNSPDNDLIAVDHQECFNKLPIKAYMIKKCLNNYGGSSCDSFNLLYNAVTGWPRDAVNLSRTVIIILDNLIDKSIEHFQNQKVSPMVTRCLNEMNAYIKRLLNQEH